jgi:hypothetical protein
MCRVKPWKFEMNTSSNQLSTPKWKDTPNWLKIIAIVALLNFFSFIFISIYLGSDAWNGKEDQGHFYLNSHGHYTEVSEKVFQYSKTHAYSMWTTHSLAIFSGAFFYFEQKKPLAL